MPPENENLEEFYRIQEKLNSLQEMQKLDNYGLMVIPIREKIESLIDELIALTKKLLK